MILERHRLCAVSAKYETLSLSNNGNQENESDHYLLFITTIQQLKEDDLKSACGKRIYESSASLITLEILGPIQRSG